MMSHCSLLSLILTFIYVVGDVSGLPISHTPDAPTISTDQILNYLVRFGYLAGQRSPPSVAASTMQQIGSIASTGAAPGKTGTNHSQTVVPTTAPLGPVIGKVRAYSRSEIPRAIGDFQDFMSLKKTRMVDAETRNMMVKPRCGDRDKRPHISWVPDVLYRSRRRRYVVQGSKWPKTSLQYTISQTSAKLSWIEQKVVLKAAFERWAEVCPLVFVYTSNKHAADINIRFASGAHGDNKVFDGPGNILAHAFFPNVGGDIHFDEDETWATGLSVVPANAKSLLTVAVHEIGHAMGLRHSTVANSVMRPIFDSTASNELNSDDISGIQSLYGRCSTTITSAFSWIGNGKTYFFKGKHTWRFNDERSEIEKRYPVSIQTEWDSIPNDIDEAFLWGQNYVSYFFKGDKYYRFDDYTGRVDGSPQLIRFGWRGVPDNIDAAFSLNRTVSYFFKGSLCYKYDGPTDRVLAGYPKPISHCFPGLPDNLDSAVRYYYDDRVYFFKGLYYYLLNSNSNTVSGPKLIEMKWKNLCFT